MRNNYHYIITGLPQLVLENRSKTVSYEQMRDAILGSASDSDKVLVKWLEFGSDAKNLSTHFYYASLKCKNRFIRDYFRMDLLIRNYKVEYISSKAGNETPEYCIYPSNFSKLSEDALLFEELEPIFSTPDILKKEEMLDNLKWNRLNEMVPYGEFSIDVILIFLAKLMLIDRWNKLDAEKGARLFKQLVDEVKGTYKAE